MSLHISKAAAADRAKQLAEEFMSRQDTRGWEWTLSIATPDKFNPSYNGRKIATRWVISVQYAEEGVVADGPALLYVDIANGTVTFG
jgi:hypothetical protein